MKIGERGQVTIPKNIREKYGLMPYIEVEFVLEKTGVLIKKKSHQSKRIL
jgi:AbrB family looped-hinge helix DNA binding protein